MQSFSHPVFYAALMFVADLGIPVMAALNGGLGGKLQSPALAATILLLVGLFIAVAYLFVVEGMPAKLYVPNTAWYIILVAFLSCSTL